ncbi:MAG: hypothetical protein WAQ53_15610 [Thiofilum sp.]|uniref:hypothetical protein n=1 Tax=Thiofilum sp. TaxID=2212733 RepID=UPI0025DA688C|nr:hypothetical protein [Thiofilum sp.]MBK8455433.1 hypothetical protein [Thiofilum sp.]
MKSSFHKTTLVASIALLTVFTSVAQAGNPADWIIEGNGSLVDGARFSLRSEDQGSYLRYQDRAGVNLGWSNGANNFMRIERASGGNNPLQCGEPFALFIEKEYIIYEKQNIGINLSSRTRNKNYYQWKFDCGGGPVPTNAPLKLTNGNSAIVGCKRIAGVNICWAGDVITYKGKNYRLADACRFRIPGTC